MTFSWDWEKERKNLKKHKVTFDEAVLTIRCLLSLPMRITLLMRKGLSFWGSQAGTEYW